QRAHMLTGPDARRGDGELARVGARVADELLEARGSQILAADERVGEGAHYRHWREIASWIVAQVLVQSRVERHVRQTPDEQRVAIGCRRRHGLRADERAATRAVLDDERLAELRRQALGDEAPDHVVAH